ncbi:hypothetical protein IscW_ISCW021676 [Ixodes scapularis]|uniref:Uncharacterized protein n=1 Tax=Ixodes scapularis TaxID=6945 RepID=B7Q455_IXOSC|nr:hypothetical protein IscW_ISCW021676 [Ixodes scapularis]|eukprot:XP_002411479.1 hypothetical protein IscW_ISCW021676 [Ixodes scapularis]
MREKLFGMASQMNGKGSILFGFLNSRQIRLHLNCLDKIPGQLLRREFSCKSSIFQTIVPGLYVSKSLHFTQCRSSKAGVLKLGSGEHRGSTSWSHGFREYPYCNPPPTPQAAWQDHAKHLHLTLY